jgi:hypothetical protein
MQDYFLNNLTQMYRNNFFVDKITNSIEDAITGKRHDTQVIAIIPSDLKTILKKNGWKFDWKTESKKSNQTIYKLIIKDDTIIQGLIIVRPEENHVEMPLIEAAPHNLGKSKKYIGVAGNLVAFACKMSFSLGFGGVVAFKAKTKLIQHYINTLGAKLIFKDRMCIYETAAKKLVNSYYKNYSNDR